MLPPASIDRLADGVDMPFSAAFRSPRLFKLALNCYPPYFCTGISIVDVAPDFRRLVVQMKQRPYNANAFGTHFGGSLYAMCDPHFALLLVPLLGPDYLVWDKAATIEFLRPGRGTMRAEFSWNDAQLDDIRAHTDGGAKYEPIRIVDVTSEAGELIARVHKTLYVRKKADRRE